MNPKWNKGYKSIRRKIQRRMKTYRELWGEGEKSCYLYPLFAEIETLVDRLPPDDIGRTYYVEAERLLDNRAAEELDAELLADYWGSV